MENGRFAFLRSLWGLTGNIRWIFY